MTVQEEKNRIFSDNTETPGFVGAGIGENDIIQVYWEDKDSIIEIESEFEIKHIITGIIKPQVETTELKKGVETFCEKMGFRKNK